jgi:SAM-dependent methyltransferase
MSATFWNDRFRSDTYVYGTAPNRFVRAQVNRWSEDASVLELGAGEGRNAIFLAEQGRDVTALDYAEEGLRKLKQLAEARGVSVDTVQADVTTWTPDRQWDGVVNTFLHLPPAERPALYQTMQAALRPGGVLVAEWFRPEQITGGYDSGGPPTVEMMVTEDELRTHFPEKGVQLLRAVETTLDEGPYHRGPAAVVRLVWKRPRD